MAYMDRKGRSRFVETLFSFQELRVLRPYASWWLWASRERPGRVSWPPPFPPSPPSTPTPHQSHRQPWTPDGGSRRTSISNRGQPQVTVEGLTFRIVLITTPTSPVNRLEAGHIDARRRITNICALPLLLFFGWIPCTGWPEESLKAQLSDRIHQFTVFNHMPLAFLTKLSIMHWI